MENLYKKYKQQKLLEILLYLLNNIKEPTFTIIMKAMFSADRYSFINYGTLLSGLQYKAYKDGPEPFEMRHCIKEQFLHSNGILNEIIRIEENDKLTPLRKACSEYFAKTDLRSLNHAIYMMNKLNYKKDLSQLFKDNVYKRIINSNNKIYNNEDIALTQTASHFQIMRIKDEDQINSILL